MVRLMSMASCRHISSGRFGPGSLTALPTAFSATQQRKASVQMAPSLPSSCAELNNPVAQHISQNHKAVI